jgi:hypothetical protein
MTSTLVDGNVVNTIGVNDPEVDISGAFCRAQTSICMS